jgi:hypothetical protein
MTPASRLIVTVAIASIAIQANGYGQQSEERSRRSTVTLCQDASGCLPHWTSTLVVYVTDSSGAAVANAQVAVYHSSSSISVADRLLATDDHGMLAVSVLPPNRVDVRITSSGFLPATMDNIAIEAGRLQIVDVRLVVDSKALRGVF